MMTKVDILKIINECRITGEKGLRNGYQATIQELFIDFLTPPTDFLGVNGNPAIFVNFQTFHLLSKYHPDWEINKTIAVKESFLKEEPMMIIGILIHEIGHAFNVAAKILNCEANAYIFEIEVLSSWFHSKHPVLARLSNHTIQSYFDSRLPYYHKEIGQNPYLDGLIQKIEMKTILNPAEEHACSHSTQKRKGELAMMVSVPKLRHTKLTHFFRQKDLQETADAGALCVK